MAHTKKVIQYLEMILQSVYGAIQGLKEFEEVHFCAKQYEIRHKHSIAL